MWVDLAVDCREGVEQAPGVAGLEGVVLRVPPFPQHIVVSTHPIDRKRGHRALAMPSFGKSRRYSWHRPITACARRGMPRARARPDRSRDDIPQARRYLIHQYESCPWAHRGSPSVGYGGARGSETWLRHRWPPGLWGWPPVGWRRLSGHLLARAVKAIVCGLAAAAGRPAPSCACRGPWPRGRAP